MQDNEQLGQGGMMKYVSTASFRTGYLMILGHMWAEFWGSKDRKTFRDLRYFKMC